MSTGYRTYGQFVLEGHDSGYRVDTDFGNLDNVHKTKYPLASFSSRKGGSTEKKTSKFVLFEEDMIDRSITIDTAITTTDTSAVVNVSSTDGIVVGTLLHVPGTWLASVSATVGELLRVTAITTSITVTRVTTNVGIPDTSPAVIMNNHVSETSTTSVASFDMEPTGVLGYMSIIKRSVTITKTEKNSATRGNPGEGRLAEKLRRAKMEFMVDVEHDLWFSQALSNPNSGSFRYSMGIIAQLVGNSSSIKFDAGANALALEDIGDPVAQTAKYADSNEFVVFHGSQVMTGLWELQMADIQARSGENKWGMFATSVKAPGGFQLDFVFCRTFDILGTPFSKWMVGLNMPHIKPVHLKNGRPKLERRVEADPGGEVEEYQWRRQGGIAISNPQRHWMTYDVVNYS